MSAKKVQIFEGEQKILEALKNKHAFDFIKRAFKTHYQYHFSQYASQVERMVEDSFRLLLDSQLEGDSFLQLERIVIHIYYEIFRKNDPSFWFNRIYVNYKKNIRPKIEFREIQPYILGKKVLDFGSGTGSLALELESRGYLIYTADILDYRFSETTHIPFKKMNSPRSFSVETRFDTIMIKAVLHHVNKDDLIPIIENLKRAGRRFIIEESTFDINQDLDGVTALMRSQPIFEEFMKLPKHDQVMALVILDFFTNALAFGKPEMNLPFEFKSVEQWKALFKELKLNLVDIDILGFEKERITPDSRALFICDVI